MAYFKSLITDAGADLLAQLIVSGEKLVLTSAVAGTGRVTGNPASLNTVVDPSTIEANLGDVKIGADNVIVIPVQITNAEIKQSVAIREIGIMATYKGANVLLAYSYLVGNDTDNVIYPSNDPVIADTIHIQDVALVMTPQEAANVTVEVSAGSFVTESRLKSYAAPVDHTHTAAKITESTGETVEVVQRRQDYEIQAMKEQLDTGFVGTTLTHTFAEGELENWYGYYGTGYPDGVYIPESASLTA